MRSRGSSGRLAAGAALLAIVVGVLATGVAAGAAKPAPRLGRKWGPDQRGYGLVRPGKIFNGGDPTGLVEHVHWTGWGGAQAIGHGTAEYVWPGTSVAANPLTSGARVVAFHLGTCRGRRSYNAIEWYFPKYDEVFDPHSYIDICTGRFVGGIPKQTSCHGVKVADGSGTATMVLVTHMACATAAPLIAASPVAKYEHAGGRFVRSGFRCGTAGAIGGVASFFCERGRRAFQYDVAA